MGNQSSDASFFIELDKPFYTSGDIICGYVHASLGGNHRLNNVGLSIEGKENVEWSDGIQVRQKSQTSNIGETKLVGETLLRPHDTHFMRIGEKCNFTQYTSLGLFPSNGGQYSYPFKIALPNNLPGTFEYIDEKFNASISYSLEVRANKFDGTPFIFRRMVFIRQPITLFKYPSVQSNKAEISDFCRSRGFAGIKVTCEKTFFIWGDEANLTVEIDNRDCRLNSSGINLSLNQKITLHDSYGKIEYKTRVVSNKYIPSSTQPGQESTRTVSLPITDLNNPMIVHSSQSRNVSYYDGTHVINQLQTTVRGQTVQCEFFIQVFGVWEGCQCCSGPGNIEYPIVIYNNVTLPDVQSLKPQNWAPRQMDYISIGHIPEMNVNINSGGMMQGGTNPSVNININGNTGMMQGGTQPMNSNVNISGGGMMQGGTQPMNSNVSISSGGMMQGGSQPMNQNMNISVSSGGMMQGGNQPMNSNFEINMSSSGMMQGGTNPSNVNSGGMMQGGSDPNWS